MESPTGVENKPRHRLPLPAADLEHAALLCQGRALDRAPSLPKIISSAAILSWTISQEAAQMNLEKYYSLRQQMGCFLFETAGCCNSGLQLQIILICSIATVRYNHKAKTTNSLSSLFRHPQPSFAESSLRIRTALQSDKWSKEMEMKLQNLVIVLNNYVVNQVLKSLLDFELGFHFYLWAESQRGFKHDHSTIKSMICLLLKCQRFDLLSVILRKLHDDGFTPHRSIYRILISGYVKCGLLSFAFETFDEMIVSSCRVFSVDYNKFIGVLIKNRCFDLAEKTFAKKMVFDLEDFELLIARALVESPSVKIEVYLSEFFPLTSLASSSLVILAHANAGLPVPHEKVFNRTHRTNKGRGPFVDKKSKKTFESYTLKLNEKQAQSNDTMTLASTNASSTYYPDLWIEASGGLKNGRCYGFGNSYDESVIFGTSSRPNAQIVIEKVAIVGIAGRYCRVWLDTCRMAGRQPMSGG
ncbi:hypothetical protein KSP40_PGU018940 [Platanthera guangdongensis]|uniref:Pentatricopeptide repeat-containing protein n=1 Tax=Platanthera guangdongensis TaxID=2320717 RepID=A0ABR2LWI2_9ASPA